MKVLTELSSVWKSDIAKRFSNIKILITSAASRTAQLLKAGLGEDHEVTMTDLPGKGEEEDLITSDLGHDESTDELVAGIQALVLIGFEGQMGDASSLIDYHTRRTYNLLLAAASAGVERCVYVSTLRLLEDYDEILTITERWRSLPPGEDPVLLSCHLGEIVCKEFARDRLIKVATVRLGFPIVEGTRDSLGSEESAAISSEDACLAVGRALSADIAPWQDIHVQSPLSNQRFLMKGAQRILQYPEGEEK